MNTVTLEGREIPYLVTYNRRRSRISIVVHPGKTVEIRAPEGVPGSVLHRVLEERSDWIRKKIELAPPARVTREYADGEIFFFLGSACTLRYNRDLSPGVVTISGENLQLGLPPGIEGEPARKFARDHVIAWYRSGATRVIHDLCLSCSARIGIEPPGFRVRNIAGRWGSCSHNNHLNFTLRLVMAPERLVRYVVVHELCHIRQKDHSPVFWAHVKEIVPDYQACREELKALGYQFVL